MTLTPRNTLALAIAGLIFAAALAGCRSARYESADNSPGDTRYGATPPLPEPPSYHQPPAVRGPSEPVPVLPHDPALERPAPPPRPNEGAAARRPHRGPALEAFSYDDEEADADDELHFPEARRGRPAGGSLRARLSSLRGTSRPAAPVATQSPEKTPVSAAPGHAELHASESFAERDNPRATRQPEAAGPPLAERIPLPVSPPEAERPVRRVRAERTEVSAEPVRLTDPPQLVAPPTTADRTEITQSAHHQFSIERIEICREVRDFDDLVEVDRDKLKARQPLLIYTALANFRSLASRDGFRTMTRSRLEIRDASGQIVWSQPLGSATDLSQKPRHEYYLTHDVTVPATLPPDEYTFIIRVDDLLGEQTTVGDIDVRIQGGS